MPCIELKGRKIPLTYTTLEMLTIQKKLGNINDAINSTVGRNPEDEKDTRYWGSIGHIETLGTMIEILGNAGLREAGETQDLKAEWILTAIKPGEIGKYSDIVITTMTEGMKSEIPKEEKETGPVDVTLEEMERKKEQTS